MGALEIVLLLAGSILAVLGFVLPAAKDDVPQETKKLAQDEIKFLVGQEMNNIRQHVDDVVGESIEYAVEKTERSLERLTNEKIMAVNEYSDTVLEDIHKNHEEAMFLYDMLNDKHTSLKNMMAEVNKTVQEAEEVRRETEAAAGSYQQMRPGISGMQGSSMTTAQEPLTGLKRLSQAAAAEKEAMERAAAEKAAMERAAMEKAAAEQAAMERAAMEKAAAEQAAMEQAAMEKAAAEQAAMEQAAMEKAAAEFEQSEPVDNESPEAAVTIETAEQPEAAAEYVPEPIPVTFVPEVPAIETAGAPEAAVPEPVTDLYFMTADGENTANNNERILSLYQQGKSKVAIARELGLGVGEVKLVIDLYKSH